MPWQLDIPVGVGGLDSASYDQVQITRLVHDSVREYISLVVEYGRTVAGEWVPGYAPKDKMVTFHIDGQAYQDLISSAEPNAGPPIEKTYEAVKRGAYEWLHANNHISDGSVV